MTREVIDEMAALGRKFQGRLNVFDRRQAFVSAAEETSLVQLARIKAQLNSHQVSVILSAGYRRSKVVQ